MLEQLKRQVCEANLELVKRGVVLYTWGNASGIDREQGLVVIKPSGVDYNCMTPEDMVVVELATGKVIEGQWRPSSDTPTHLVLYRRYEMLGGVVHTHSTNVVVFAQAGMGIPALGTTHADHFYGEIPCTRDLTKAEAETDYEVHTGKVIVETIDNLGYNPITVPGIIVKSHGPFAWGSNVHEAVCHAVVMEQVAEMAMKTLLLNREAAMPSYLLDKHYQRKHGPDAYYGQTVQNNKRI